MVIFDQIWIKVFNISMQNKSLTAMLWKLNFEAKIGSNFL